MTSITIRFKAKRDDFPAGVGYSVPRRLTASHVAYSDRETLATLLAGTRDYDVWLTQLQRYGLSIPGVIWEDGGGGDYRHDTTAWSIRPLGNGFMAELSLTHELKRTPSQ